jgi:hypothetical protein
MGTSLDVTYAASEVPRPCAWAATTNRILSEGAGQEPPCRDVSSYLSQLPRGYVCRVALAPQRPANAASIDTSTMCEDRDAQLTNVRRYVPAPSLRGGRVSNTVDQLPFFRRVRVSAARRLCGRAQDHRCGAFPAPCAVQRHCCAPLPAVAQTADPCARDRTRARPPGNATNCAGRGRE